MSRPLSQLVLVLALGIPSLCLAQDKVDPNSVTTGTVRIETNTEWVKFLIDGKELDSDEAESSVFFEDEGKTLLIGGIDRTSDHVIKVMPTSDELKWEELTITPKEWKLTKIDKNTKEWRVIKSVKFRKWNPGEKEKLEQPKQPEPPAEPPVEPPAAAPAEPAPAPADPAAPEQPAE